jgi:hypothetical protein
MRWSVSDKTPNEKLTSLGNFEALTLLYLQKQQDLDGCTPEELVSRYIEGHDRIVKEFARQQEVRKRRLNPLPV